ncbi:MAG: cadmium-translocating P-type ATPase [Bacteroidetes bacterium]|nr:cadmium-translocating P-type ATPase [Bacteroidota bacterium]
MNENNKQISLKVEGMSCTGCAVAINRIVTKNGGINSQTDYITGDVYFQLPAGPAHAGTVEKIVSGINAIGYKAATKGKENNRKDVSVKIKFLVSLVFTVPLLIPMILPVHFLHNPVVQIALSSPVFIIGFFHFGKSVLRVIRTGSADMDLLIFIGIVSAYGYSLAGTILFFGTAMAANYLFFETSATITTLVLLGNLIEHRSVEKTSSAIKELASSKPHKAKKIIFINGAESISETETGNLEPGDTVSVNSGDRIPADGMIITGRALISEAMITGESIPVEKVAGSNVFSGTINVSGNIRVRVETIGEGTLLDRIIRIVEDARHSKPSIHRLADRVSAVFVPVIIAIAVATCLVSFFIAGIPLGKALMNSIAVLVIACPCAMGLATPTAVMVGLGKAAKNGIIFKGGEIIEEFSRIKNIVFDKTGTLTTGNFVVKNIEPANGFSKQELIRYAYHIEKFSSHPIAKSIQRELSGKAGNLEITGVTEETGKGLEAQDGSGNVVRIGSLQYVIPGEKSAAEDRYNIFISRNGTLMGHIEIEDEITRNAAGMIKAFRDAGVISMMVSGDSEKNCEKIARLTGIDKFFSRHKPDEKLIVIENLSKNGKTAMVGDGINDAPALARANIGVSFGNATDIAIRNAQVVLLTDNNLMNLWRAYRIAGMTVSTIKQNLFWALFYNVVAVPVAAFGFLNPMVGALTMAFSDVIVIGNSLRLRSRKPD